MVANQREINEDPGSRNTLGAVTDLSVVEFSANSNSHLAHADNSDFTIFDGTDDFAFSIAFWVNLTADGSDSGVRRLFGKFEVSHNEYYLNYRRSDGLLSITLHDATADGGGTADNSFQAPTVESKKFFEDSFGSWVHVGIVYTPETGDDNNTEQIQYYKNGSAWGSPVVSPTDSYDSSQDGTALFVLGAMNASRPTSERVIGFMSNFLFYKHDGQSNDAGLTRGTAPLTAGEVSKLYNGGEIVVNHMRDAKANDLVAYWKLNEDMASASQITDYSYQGNHMTTIGSAVTSGDTTGLEINTQKTLTWAQRRMTIPGLSSLRTNPQK